MSVQAGVIERALIEIGVAVAGGLYINEKQEKQLAGMITLQRFLLGCDRLGGADPDGYCGEVSQDEVMKQSEVFGEQAVADFKQCWKEADELSTGDETEDARGQCKYELEATEREFDAWMAKQDSAS